MNGFYAHRPYKGTSPPENQSAPLFRKTKMADFINILREPKHVVRVIHSALEPAMLAKGKRACRCSGVIKTEGI